MIVQIDTQTVGMHFNLLNHELSDLQYYVSNRNSKRVAWTAETPDPVDWNKHERGEKVLLNICTAIRNAGIE